MKRASPNKHKAQSRAFTSAMDSGGKNVGTESFSTQGKQQLLLYKQQMQDFEDGLMGHDEGNNKSDAIERNTNLMVDVLRNKIKAMEDAAKTRIRLCAEDFNENSEESSNTAPKMLEAFEEAFLKGLKDSKSGTTTHKEKVPPAALHGPYLAPHLTPPHLLPTTNRTTWCRRTASSSTRRTSSSAPARRRKRPKSSRRSWKNRSHPARCVDPGPLSRPII